MANYYNEIDAYAAEWLRNLMKKGLIPDGEVDTRSISDVVPNDLAGFTQCHFFAGIAGWSHALRLAGWPDDRLIWTGSCPCQPFSVAGKGKGTADERHLWPVFFNLIRECRPPVVMGEQVAGKAGYGWLDGVRSDLEGEGYACRGVDIPACAANSPHIRQRLYWVAVEDASNDGTRRIAGAAENSGWRALDAGTESLRRSDGARGPSGSDARDTGDHADLANTNLLLSEQHARNRARPVEAPRAGSHAEPSRRSELVSGDMADADSRDPRAGRGNDGEMRGIPAAERGPEDGAAVSGRGGEGYGHGDMADAMRSQRREVSKGRLHVYDGADAGRQEATSGYSLDSFANGSFWSDAIWLTGADGKARRAKPGICLLADGVPARVGRLRAFGNAIVPPLAAEVIKAFMDV